MAKLGTPPGINPDGRGDTTFRARMVNAGLLCRAGAIKSGAGSVSGAGSGVAQPMNAKRVGLQIVDLARWNLILESGPFLKARPLESSDLRA